MRPIPVCGAAAQECTAASVTTLPPPQLAATSLDLSAVCHNPKKFLIFKIIDGQLPHIDSMDP